MSAVKAILGLMQKLVPEIPARREEEIAPGLKMLVSAYDPCISCFAHSPNIKVVDR